MGVVWSRDPLEWTFRYGKRKGEPLIVVDRKCWIWQGSTAKKGYGEITFPLAQFPGMKMCRVHTPYPTYRKCRVYQLTYFIKHGNHAPGLELGHECARRLCCHWDHVRPVTQNQNFWDKFQTPYLPKATLKEIRYWIAHDVPLQQIADDLGVSVWNVRAVAEQMNWGATLQSLVAETTDDGLHGF